MEGCQLPRGLLAFSLLSFFALLADSFLSLLVFQSLSLELKLCSALGGLFLAGLGLGPASLGLFLIFPLKFLQLSPRKMFLRLNRQLFKSLAAVLQDW